MTAVAATDDDSESVFSKGKAPAIPLEAIRSDAWSLLRSELPLFGLTIALVGTIIFGIATPTEATAAGALGALVIAAANRRIIWPMLKDSALETIETVGKMGFLIVGVLAFTSAFLEIGAQMIVSAIILGISGQPIVILLATLLFRARRASRLDSDPVHYAACAHADC